MSDDLTPSDRVSAPLLTHANQKALIRAHVAAINERGGPNLIPAVERIVREHARQGFEQGVDAAFISISFSPYMGRGGITNPYDDDLPEEG